MGSILTWLFRLIPLRQEAMIVTLGYNYIGASADVNIWNPSIDSDHHGDYSSGQIWLLGGPGDNFNSVESGWIVIS